MRVHKEQQHRHHWVRFFQSSGLLNIYTDEDRIYIRLMYIYILYYIPYVYIECIYIKLIYYVNGHGMRIWVAFVDIVPTITLSLTPVYILKEKKSFKKCACKALTKFFLSQTAQLQYSGRFSLFICLLLVLRVQQDNFQHSRVYALRILYERIFRKLRGS